MNVVRLKQVYRDYFLSMPGVVGLGVGGSCDGECLRVYTDRPVSLPGSVEGVPLMPYRAGAFTKFSVVSYPPSYYQQAFRPCPAGVSIGTYSETLHEALGGTLGLVVPDSDGSPLLLSNNHVMGLDFIQGDGISVGQRIQQPMGGGDIAGLLRWVPLDLDNPNLVDCALATPFDPADMVSTVLGVGQPSYVSDPLRGMDVAKVGMESGFTIGHVIDVNASVRMQYGPYTVTLEDQVIVGNGGYSFAKPGDSGSALLVNVYGKLLAVGLLVGGSDILVVASKMSLVQKALQFRMPFYALNRSPTPPMVALAGAILAPAFIH